MKLLYISSVCTPKILDYIFNSSNIKPGQAVQKFHRLLVEGLSAHNTLCEVEVLSSLPVSPSGHDRKYWNLSDDYWKGVRFRYVPFVNFRIVKHLFVFFIAFFKVLFWNFYYRKKDRIVICDLLNVSIVWATFFACKLTRQPIALIVTDLPIFMVSSLDKHNFLKRVYLKLATFIMHRFDYYIGLTKQMNEVVNPFEKPFLVMEGLVDIEMSNKKNCMIPKNTERILLYAGGIYEKYGVKNLIESFITLRDENLRLHIYGSGDLEHQMVHYCEMDKRISYFGVVSNALVVKALEKASILINPRPNTEEFTKFSFPSKNMEYMVSGVPLLTTKLLGMPSEYNDYVYFFQDESVEGMSCTLAQLLLKEDDELKFFGKKAKQFVLDYKSNVTQAKKIIDFLSIK